MSVKRPSAVADWGYAVTVTYTVVRGLLLGLPYVVETCRKILSVLCRNNLLIHITRCDVNYEKFPENSSTTLRVIVLPADIQTTHKGENINSIYWRM